MARYREAPYGFECPYPHKCPHLGVSAVHASALLSDIERDEFRNGHALTEAMKEIDALGEENRELSARVAELESRLKRQHRMRFKRNSSPDEPQAGGAPNVCPHCAKAGLAPAAKAHAHVQEDIVLQPQTVVTEYVHEPAWCPSCRREVFATADGELRNCAVGPVAQAAAVYPRHEVKLSYRDVGKVFSGFFGLSFVPASAMAFSHRTADRGGGLYEDLRDRIRASAVVHGDETHWRIGGKSAFLWYAGNERVAFFHADRSRGSGVAASIFGSVFAGSLVADGYAGYNAVNPRRRQACLAHLKRKAKETAERVALMPERLRDAPSLRFCKTLEAFFPFCCRLDRRRREGRLSFSAAKAFVPRLSKTLREICLLPPADADAENLRRVSPTPNATPKTSSRSWKSPACPPTNNHAEQSLRLPVIFRKISFGSQSLRGAQALAVNLSLITTAKRHGRDPLELIKTVLFKAGDTPLDAMYDPDCLPKTDSS